MGLKTTAWHGHRCHCVSAPQVLPPGVVASNTRPLPVPVELCQLESLSDILNLDTWANELDESDRASLRALLPNKVREAAWVGLGRVGCSKHFVVFNVQQCLGCAGWWARASVPAKMSLNTAHEP
jgi:hypothetical protein